MYQINVKLQVNLSFYLKCIYNLPNKFKNHEIIKKFW